MGIILEIDRLLRGAEPTPKSTIAQQLYDMALLMKRRSMVILISDLFADADDILRGLDHLRFAGHDVIVFHTLDPFECQFPFKGTWRFEGLEGEEHLITQPERIRESYLTNFNKYLETLRTGCIGSNVDYSLVDTSRPLDAVLGEFMDKRASALSGVSSGARQ
jgi:hypothetical protein